MGKLTKNQKRKKKVQAKKKAHQIQSKNEDRAWQNRFNKERSEARKKIRASYRANGMKEEQIQKLVPESEDIIKWY